MQGNACDADDDNDLVPDVDDSVRTDPFVCADSAPLNRFVCSDLDGDACDDCNSGVFDTSNDGLDLDGDGSCDVGDTDDDNDGVTDSQDSDPSNANVCRDADGDTCDDCTSGTDAPSNDGADFDGDGLCDAGDLDDDNDDLSDAAEALAGTDPFDQDSDNDGLFDGAEVNSAVDGCPDPLNADSDGDTISDGNEVAAGTNPCNADTNGDGVPDNEDPTPTEPGVTSGFLEDTTRDLAQEIVTLSLDSVIVASGGGNGNGSTNAKTTRRNRLVNWTIEAANLIADGDIQGAIDELEKVLKRVDGDPSPPDWLEDGADKDELREAIALLMALLQLEL